MHSFGMLACAGCLPQGKVNTSNFDVSCVFSKSSLLKIQDWVTKLMDAVSMRSDEIRALFHLDDLLTKVRVHAWQRAAATQRVHQRMHEHYLGLSLQQ